MDDNWDGECIMCGANPTTHWDEGTDEDYCRKHALVAIIAGNKFIVPYYDNDEAVL